MRRRFMIGSTRPATRALANHSRDSNKTPRLVASAVSQPYPKDSPPDGGFVQLWTSNAPKGLDRTLHSSNQMWLKLLVTAPPVPASNEGGTDISQATHGRMDLRC